MNYRACDSLPVTRRPVVAQDRPSAQRCIIGVDPGADGAIAAISASGRFLGVRDMPTMLVARKRVVDGFELDALLVELADARDAVVWVEQVGARKGQGVTSMFSFGRSLGAVEALVRARRWPLEYVTPQDWQRSAGLPKGSGGAKRNKAPSVDAAKRLYPEAESVLYGPQGGMKADRAEAILIARYGWRMARIGVQADIEDAA